MTYPNFANPTGTNLGSQTFENSKNDEMSNQCNYGLRSRTTNMWFSVGKVDKVAIRRANTTKNKNCKRCEQTLDTNPISRCASEKWMASLNKRIEKLLKECEESCNIELKKSLAKVKQ